MSQPAPQGVGAPTHPHHQPGRPRCDHLVSFYEDADFLAAAVGPFLLEGLEHGETVLVVARPEHRAAFAKQLVAAGHDLDRSRREQRYRELDAASTLAELAPDGALTAERFSEGIAGAVTALAQAPGGFRAYGEMVALLWERGALALALELEDRWNAALAEVTFPMFCGYPLAAFDTPETTARFHDVCARHTRVTTNSYGALRGADAGNVVMLPVNEPGGSRS